MIDPQLLLADLARQLKTLESDLRQRIAELPDLRGSLQDEWQTATEAKRTDEPFQSWADQVITQAGVHWLLSCTFLRFAEDNGLVERPWLGGTPESGRLALARDRHEAYFRERPTETDREYLLHCFRDAGTLPGLHTFFDEAHNPVFRLAPSGDAAMALRNFWQQVDPNTGTLVHDFTDPAWNTRFLGDLYQDLSEAARKRYALLQTPEFVEEFILDRTLTPAIRTFGFREVRMIDPTCGSGHFLLGGFARLVAEWQRAEPGRNPRDVAQKALDSVAGVDLNPCAVAISRFRLLAAALQAARVPRLAGAPDFQIHVAIGDSLLHGHRFGLGGQTATRSEQMFDEAQAHADEGIEHAYASEDLAQVKQILGRQYHAVVGNPPYIVVRDAALNAAYRKRYASCHRQYSLGCPFTERFFELALTGERYGQAGFVGLITANSFMKREFGSKLIEDVLPRVDLTHVIDTSGAYIPGHGTPTVILLGCHRPPHDDLHSASNTVRAVMGIKGEPSKPQDPAQGFVWRAIVNQVDRPGSASEFVSVLDTPRVTFGKHPWSIGGGGAAELLAQLNVGATQKLADLTIAIGRTTHTGEDAAFFVPLGWSRRFGAEEVTVPLVEGDAVRDFALSYDTSAIFPYQRPGLQALPRLPAAIDHHFWTMRTPLRARSDYGNSIESRGLKWWEHSMFFPERFRQPLGIAYADIATHNHFVLDRGGEVFNRTAPVIKLPAGSSEDNHLALLGLLNSSVACFWLKQVCFPKGGDHVGNEGARVRKTLWDERYAFNATNIGDFPLPPVRPLALAHGLDQLARLLANQAPRALLAAHSPPTRAILDSARQQTARMRREMIASQEELDWQCYRLYGLLPDGSTAADFECATPPELKLGERAFEIVLARRVAAGDETTTWFERHGSTPLTKLPAHWPADYRAVIERRIALVESDRNIGLIERPEYKRRWNTPAWDDLENAALRDWLLDRLEQPAFWPASADTPSQLTTTSRVADLACADADFMHVAALYAGHADFDPARLVAELVAAEAVPLLPVLRYTEDGVRKRQQWEDAWALQRREDAIDAEVIASDAPGWRAEMEDRARRRFNADEAEAAQAWVEEQLAGEIKRRQAERKANEVGPIPVPPKYKSSDFLRADFWRLRGGLDVPKERFVSFPGAERGADGSLVVAWAGWNQLQLATALAGWYLDVKDNEGWPADRLQPLLAGLRELLPWLRQWHNDLDPVFNERMGDYYAGFVADEARTLGFTLEDLKAWRPSAAPARRGRRRSTSAAST
ncbi:MAG: BREX-2 system adenine-specific DNA-methyltransferase PglX [Ramlibacter sp.]